MKTEVKRRERWMKKNSKIEIIKDGMLKGKKSEKKADNEIENSQNILIKQANKYK